MKPFRTIVGLLLTMSLSLVGHVYSHPAVLTLDQQAMANAKLLALWQRHIHLLYSPTMAQFEAEGKALLADRGPSVAQITTALKAGANVNARDKFGNNART